MTAAPSMAEVLAEHRRVEIHNRPLRGGRIEHYRTCTCGLDLPWNSVDAEEAHRAHVAQALAGAGFGHVASVERERDAYRRAKQENDERFQIEAQEQRARAERAEALAAEMARLLQDAAPSTIDPGLRRAWGRKRRTLVDAALDGEATS